MKTECEYCKKDLDKDNPKFVLMELSNIGYTELNFCNDKCYFSYLLKKFGKKLSKIERDNTKCFLCGKKATLHSLSGKNTPPYVPLCKEHHLDIENIKMAVIIMKKERKISPRRFRQIIDSMGDK